MSDTLAETTPLASTSTSWTRTHWLRLAEFLVLFVAAPVALVLVPFQVRPLPLLWVAAIGVLIVLLRDPSFDRAQLTRLPNLGANVARILLLVPFAALAMAGVLHLLYPPALFDFVERLPHVWVFVMFLYPIFSVLPQTLLYRTFFFHRYQMLFGSGLPLIVVAAGCFALGHLLFKHWLPIALTFVGGLIFAWRYYSTRSTFLAALEHAIHGNLAFTIGYGYYLYHGSVRLTEQLVQ